LITLISDDKYNALYLRNYAISGSRTSSRAFPASAKIRMFGGGDYAMRIWLGPDKIASRGMTRGDVVRASRSRTSRSRLASWRRTIKGAAIS